MLSNHDSNFSSVYPCRKQGGTLHPYQLEGVNWLRHAYQQRLNVILADEMGLGKTCQAISHIAAAHHARGPRGRRPHLVVAPLSTLRNWERELAAWAPHMNVVVLAGNQAGRDVIRTHELFFSGPGTPAPGGRAASGGASGGSGAGSAAGSTKNEKNEAMQAAVKFHVLLTSYEIASIESTLLNKLAWDCVVVDEGHRLRSKESKLFSSLASLRANHRTLLTGTPLQNRLEELFMLLHFLEPGKFRDLEGFQEEFGELRTEEKVEQLHGLLRPHLLRRLKKDVLKAMPPKKELIVRVDLSPEQKKLYKNVLLRNYSALRELSRQGASAAPPRLMNVMMARCGKERSLRTLYCVSPSRCCHSFCFFCRKCQARMAAGALTRASPSLPPCASAAAGAAQGVLPPDTDEGGLPVRSVRHAVRGHPHRRLREAPPPGASLGGR